MSSKLYKKLLLFLCYLFFTFNSFAQKNYIQGSIISLKGDTTNGFVNYRNWRENPTSIQFKKDVGAEITTYTPKDISAFEVSLANGKETYKAAKVTIESSSDIIDRMDRTPEFNNREDDLFLLLIYKGSYNLYSFEDQKLHFFIEYNNQIDELQSKNYLIEAKNTVTSNNQYKNQLSDLLKTCTQITITEINNLKYRGNELVKLLKKYDECNGLKSEEIATPENIKVGFGMIVATDFSNLSVKSDRQNFKTNSAGNFAVGFSFALKLPRNNRSSSFNLELLYRKYQFENNTENIIHDEYYYKYHYKFTGNYIKSNIMYRYQWNLAKLKPFINLGISQALALSTIDRSTTEKKFYSDISNYEDPIFPYERRHEQGINLGLGMNIYKVNIELRAETTNGFSPITRLKTSVNSLFLNLNYLF